MQRNFKNYYIEKELREIIQQVKSTFSTDKIHELKSTFGILYEWDGDPGEFKKAFEDLCYVIKKCVGPMPLSFKRKILTLARLMGIDEKYWKDVQYGGTQSLMKLSRAKEEFLKANKD